MNRLAEKISAQDIIRANSQAEAAEAQRIKQEAEQYKAQMEEIRQASEEYKSILEEMRKDTSSYKAQLQDVKSDSEEYLKRLKESEDKIHDVGVQVYRNVQAIVERGQDRNKEDFAELEKKIETLQYAVENKNSAVLPITIITMILVLADLVFNLLKFFGIIY